MVVHFGEASSDQQQPDPQPEPKLAPPASDDALFSPSLIPAEVSAQLPEGYRFRPLRRTDYDSGYIDCLRDLTTVGEIERDAWDRRYDAYVDAKDVYYIIVVEDGEGRVVATGSMVVEKKTVHNLSQVGHIEDVAVAKDQQGKKLGSHVIQALIKIGDALKCYKSILDCSEKNEGFYVKNGFRRAGLQMALYADNGKL